jgi:hypothetical protein
VSNLILFCNILYEFGSELSSLICNNLSWYTEIDKNLLIENIFYYLFCSP